LIEKNEIYINDFFNHCQEYPSLFKKADVIINTGGIAHDTKSIKDAKKYKNINIEGPLKIYKMANKFNVKRYIHFSSILVYGNNNFDKPINENNECFPVGLYSQSKLKADLKLFNLKTNFKTKLNIIRLPLVLGKNPKGNLNTLIKFCNSNIPLPFKKINNLKSFITVSTICDFICDLLLNKIIDKSLYLISEKENISTTQLILIYRNIFQKNKNLFYLPPIILKFIFFILNKKTIFNKLYNSCFYDTESYKKLYNWQPKNNLLDNLYLSIQIDHNL